MLKQILLISLILSSLVQAELTEQKLLDQIQKNKNQALGFQLPDSIGKIFGNQDININIENLIIGVKIEDNKITEIIETGLDNPTMNLYADLSTIEEILESENREAKFFELLNNDQITYSGVGIKNKLKLSFLSIGLWVYSWF